MRTGAGIRTPGSVLALHQLLLPNFKQIDGTVRQAAMDETFHNVTPQPGDTEGKLAYKRQALQKWMEAETAAPVAKGNGINLEAFNSTRTAPREGSRYNIGDIVVARNGNHYEITDAKGTVKQVR